MAIIKLTKDNFNQEVVNSQDPVLVDFWAPWCGPCKMMSPVLDAVAADEPDARIGKVNIDEQPQLAAQFGIMSIPTLALFQDGKIVITSVGLQSKRKVKAMLKGDKRKKRRALRHQSEHRGVFFFFPIPVIKRFSWWNAKAPLDSSAGSHGSWHCDPHIGIPPELIRSWER